MASLHSQHRIDEIGALVPVDWQEFREAWKRVRTRHVESWTAQQRRDWHLQAALDCMGVSAWDGAIHHLDVVRAQEPETWMLSVLRATANENLGDETQAIADLDQAILREIKHASLWEKRAYLRLRQGDLEKARTDFARAVQCGTEDVRLYQHLALLHLATNRPEDYAKMCRETLADCSPWKLQGYAGDFLVTCAADARGVTPAELIAVTEKIRNRDTHYFWARQQYALALYRAQRYAEAAKEIKVFLKDRGPLPAGETGISDLWCSMIFLRDGQKEESEKWRKRALDWRAENGSRENWAERTEFDLLLRELQAIR